MKRDYKLFIQDVIESINTIEEYLRGMTKEEFIKNREKQDAVIRILEIIGEASKNIPRSVKEVNKNISWAKISLYRDFITHSYFEASLERVWEVATKELPTLREDFKSIKLL